MMRVRGCEVSSEGGEYGCNVPVYISICSNACSLSIFPALNFPSAASMLLRYCILALP